MTLETHLNQKDSVTIKGLEKLIQKRYYYWNFNPVKPTVKRIFPKPEYKPTKLPKLVPLPEFSVEASPTHHDLPPHRWSCCAHVPGVRGRTWPSNPGFFRSKKSTVGSSWRLQCDRNAGLASLLAFDARSDFFHQSLNRWENHSLQHRDLRLSDHQDRMKIPQPNTTYTWARNCFLLAQLQSVYLQTYCWSRSTSTPPENLLKTRHIH